MEVCFNKVYFITGHQQLVLAAVIRNLDHKNVMHDAQLKSYAIQVAAALARQIRSEIVLSEIGFVSDLCRHLRKSLQATVESAGEQESNINVLLQNSIEDCLLEIAKGVSLKQSRKNKCICFLLYCISYILQFTGYVRLGMHSHCLT